MPNDPNRPAKKKQVKLQIPPDVTAVYSNLAVLSSTKNEMVFNFAQMLPPDPRAKVQARVVMSPQHAKLMLSSLQQNIERYEAQHGKIEVNIPPSLADQLFGNVSLDEDDDQ